MTQALLDRLIEVMSRAAVGQLDARVGLPPDADLDEPLVVVAQMLDVLLEDLHYREHASREAERTVARSEAKEQFLATISHEIRTPMSVVLGMTETLQSMELNAEQANCVEHLVVATDHLHALIDDVLDFSRLTSEGVLFRDAPFDVVEAAAQCVTFLADQAHATGVRITMDADVDVRRVVGDSRRIRQVIINLLSNAIKHTPGGAIHLTITATQGPAGITLGCSVADTGCGIPADLAGQLFDPFFQVDGPSRSGTGLGLAICSRIVQAMGGSIDVTSTPGIGSTFSFEVPLQTAPERTTPRPPQGATHSPSRDIRILVADDHDTVRAMTIATLNRLGYENVDAVADGTQAVSAATRERYDAIFLDMRMPGMDGLTAARAIRAAEEATGRPFIIGFTANAFEQDRQACLAAGMDHFIAKPARAETLGAVLETLQASQAAAPVVARS